MMKAYTESVQHYPGKLVITLKAADPAAMHEALLHALTTALRCGLTATQKDREALIPLSEFLESILPDEQALNR